jgi:hypothetical protein
MSKSSVMWDEPAAASSPRGWYLREGMPRGFYLDYGPGSYRPGHVSDIGCGRTASFCRPDRLCRECEPGNILAVRYPDGPGTRSESRYVVTIAEARAYVVTGRVLVCAA